MIKCGFIKMMVKKGAKRDQEAQHRNRKRNTFLGVLVALFISPGL